MVDVIVQGIKAVWEGNEAKAALTGRKGKSKGTESQRTGYRKGRVSWKIGILS